MRETEISEGAREHVGRRELDSDTQGRTIQQRNNWQGHPSPGESLESNPSLSVREVARLLGDT